MPLPSPVPGLVICYSYLWHHEHGAGAEEGSKDRPCAIIVAKQDEAGDTTAYVCPITHTPPSNPTDGLEIPSAVKRHLRLDESPSWIMTNELNKFVWPGHDLRPIDRENKDTFSWGFLPVELFESVKRSIIAHQRSKNLTQTPRT